MSPLRRRLIVLLACLLALGASAAPIDAQEIIAPGEPTAADRHTRPGNLKQLGIGLHGHHSDSSSPPVLHAKGGGTTGEAPVITLARQTTIVQDL